MLSVAQKRDIFDKARTHCVKQGKQATRGASCVYKNGDGLMCAIGAGLDEEDMKMVLVAYSAETIGHLVEKGLVKSVFGHSVSTNDEGFLAKVQIAHDRAQFRYEAGNLKVDFETAFDDLHSDLFGQD